jgi:hypothetical protein
MAGTTTRSFKTDRTAPWPWNMARIVAFVFGAFSLLGAVGNLGSDDSLVWSLMLLVVAIGFALGLFVLAERPRAATLALCGASLLAAISFYWFPPFYLVPVLVWGGSLSTLRARMAAA